MKTNTLTLHKEEILFQKPIIVTLCALFCCALWGSAFPAIKIGYALFHVEGPGSQILFAGYRFFLAGIIAFAMASIKEKKIITLKRSSIPYVFAQGILQTTIQYVFFYLGLAHTTGTKGSLINGSNAFFTIIFSHFLIKGEKMTWRKALGCLVGFAGVIAVNLTPEGFDHSFRIVGEGFVLCCAIAYGLSSVTLKGIAHRETPTTITAYQLLFGSIVLIIIGMLAGGTIHGDGLRATLLLLYLAVVSSLSFSLWATILKYNPVGKVSIFTFSIPVFGVSLSAIFLGESIFTLQNFIALILVSMGIIIVNKGEQEEYS